MADGAGQPLVEQAPAEQIVAQQAVAEQAVAGQAVAGQAGVGQAEVGQAEVGQAEERLPTLGQELRRVFRESYRANEHRFCFKKRTFSTFLLAMYTVLVVFATIIIAVFLAMGFPCPPTERIEHAENVSLAIFDVFDESYLEHTMSQNSDVLDQMIQIDSHFSRAKDLEYIMLPKSVLPDKYDVKLIPFIFENNFTFHGEVDIYVKITEDTNEIKLHASELDIDLNSTKVDEYHTGNEENKTLEITKQYSQLKQDFFTIVLADKLKKGQRYKLHMEFVGILSEIMSGFYRSSYVINNETRWIAVTQLQPTNSRLVFPCFDEPTFKARFQFDVGRLKNMTALSNMPKKNVTSEPVEGLPDYVWDHFEPTPPMSVHIAAIVVIDFDYRTYDIGFINVWARKNAIEQAQYSLKIAPTMLKYYENYFHNVDYPLPKLDLVALPDFPFGAVENWGLITFQEKTMLHQNGVSNADNKRYVAMILAHELVHQWFGNLVTHKWWSEVWLTEGFTTFMQFMGVNASEPSWKAMELFVIDELHPVMMEDSLASSHPIFTGVVFPDEIHEIFDRISYSKGGAIIRMMQHFLTEGTFQNAVVLYLKRHQNNNADQDDLWKAMTHQGRAESKLSGLKGATIKEVMDTWTLQTGYPVVSVIRDYNSGNGDIFQTRFMLYNHTTTDNSLWWIPLTYTSGLLHRHGNTSSEVQWMEPKQSWRLFYIEADPHDWVIFNVDQTGYYRVNYDPTNWQLIIQQLNSQNRFEISTINRAQLIDDAFSLARGGHLNYTTALSLTTYLSEEPEYLPWKAFFNSLRYLDNMLYRFPAYGGFRAHVVRLLERVYQKIGFSHKPNDLLITILLRNEVLSWICEYGNQDCLAHSVRLFNEWRRQSNPDIHNPITPDLKPVVYCNAIRFGGSIEWEFAWQRFLNSNVGSEKDVLLNALGCTKEQWLLEKLLYTALQEPSPIRKQDIVRVFNSVSNGVNGQNIAFKYLVNYWETLTKQFGHSIMSIDLIIKSSTKRFNTPREIKDLTAFAHLHENKLGNAKRAIDQALEETLANERWLKRNLNDIHNWCTRNI